MLKKFDDFITESMKPEKHIVIDGKQWSLDSERILAKFQYDGNEYDINPSAIHLHSEDFYPDFNFDFRISLSRHSNINLIDGNVYYTGDYRHEHEIVFNSETGSVRIYSDSEIGNKISKELANKILSLLNSCMIIDDEDIIYDYINKFKIEDMIS
jgi:hypothetical protein